MTMSLSKEEILEFFENPIIVPNYLCHTQAVEKTIKLVTEATEARDGFIRQKIKSRKEIGRINSKNFFKNKKNHRHYHELSGSNGGLFMICTKCSFIFLFIKSICIPQ